MTSIENHEAKCSLWDGFVNGWINYTKTDGRTRRKEYWGWFLFWSLLTLLIGFASAVVTTVGRRDGFGMAIAGMWGLATFVPNITITVRRLHDTGHSGMILLWYLIPNITIKVWQSQDTGLSWVPTILWFLVSVVSSIILIVLLAKRGTDGENSYGEDPKATPNEESGDGFPEDEGVSGARGRFIAGSVELVLGIVGLIYSLGKGITVKQWSIYGGTEYEPNLLMIGILVVSIIVVVVGLKTLIKKKKFFVEH